MVLLLLGGDASGGALDLPSITGLGISGALVLVIFYLLGSNRNDRAQYRQALTEQKAAYVAELSDLSRRVDDLETALDLEREERRRAEDKAAAAERRAAAAEAAYALWRDRDAGRAAHRAPDDGQAAPVA